MDFQKQPPKPNQNDCNCCIKVDNSFVLIICGELDPVQLKDSLKTFLEIKDNSDVVAQ